jgi:Protein of unknown function (DUF3800)
VLEITGAFRHKSGSGLRHSGNGLSCGKGRRTGVGSDWASQPLKRPCSLSGHKLDGDNLVRFIYLDESGISTKERVTVVAGVIVNADKELSSVEEGVQSIIADCIPEEYQEGFSFHATDLFHGGGRFFDRRHFPREVSHEILKKLIHVTAEFRLPIVYGYSEKTALYDTFKKARPKHAAAIHHAYTYSLCAIAAERYMRDSAEESELATLILENNENAQKVIKLVHSSLQRRKPDEELLAHLADLEQMAPGCVPITKIKHDPLFMSKENHVLQIADACAFTIRRFLEDKSDIKEFCDVLTGNNPKILEVDKSKDFAGYNILSYDKVD